MALRHHGLLKQLAVLAQPHVCRRMASSSTRAPRELLAALPLLTLPRVTYPGETSKLRIVEPRHRVLLKQCMSGKPHLIGLLQTLPQESHQIVGETDWKGEQIGCLATIESTGSLDEDLKKNVTTTEVTLRGLGRFQITSKRRHQLGYWIGETAIVKDDQQVDPRQLISLQAVVKELIARYARETVVDPVKLSKFNERLQFMSQQSPLAFSFWVAKQIKPAAAHDEEHGIMACQRLLELRNTQHRLEEESKMISELLKKLQFQIPLDLLIAAGSVPSKLPTPFENVPE